jgi:NADH dehydrogenase
LFQDVTRKHKGTYPNLLNNTRVILVHGGSDLVPQFEPALRQEALRSLQEKGIEVILNTRVQELGDGFARINTKKVDSETGKLLDELEESVIPIGLAVWCAGTAPVPFVSDLLSQLTQDAKYQDGRVKVDRWFRAPMADNSLLGSVFVLGDAAAFDEMGDGTLLPATAQVAGQAGAYVARLLNRGFDLETTPPLLPCIDPENDNTCDVFYDPQLNTWLKFRGFDFSPPFRFLNLGMLAYTGGGEALSQVQLGDVPILSVAGSVSYLLWRSVYLVKQVATRNRILVTFDWWKSKVFGRDITRL